MRALAAAETGVLVAALAHLAYGRIGGRSGHLVAGSVAVGSAAALGRLASGSGARHPALVLTDEALHDHASGASVGELPWSEATSVSMRRLPGSHVLQLQVRDEAALLSRLSPAARLVVRFNRRRLGAPVNVPAAACAIEPATLLEEIESRVRRRR